MMIQIEKKGEESMNMIGRGGTRVPDAHMQIKCGEIFYIPYLTVRKFMHGWSINECRFTLHLHRTLANRKII